MSSVIYEFACPICRAPIEARSVDLKQTHAPDHTRLHVLIRDGGRAIHECARRTKVSRHA
jgi:hypothetical protein